MHGADTDITFITEWLKKWDPAITPDVLAKAENAYRIWRQEREPRNAFDDNDDLARANNVVILGPTRDFKGRKAYPVYAENKTRGRLFGYSLELSRPQFRNLATLDIGSFIGRSGLSEYEDFGHRESIPNHDYLKKIYYDDYPFACLAKALRDAGVNIPQDGKEHDYSKANYRQRADQLSDLRDHVVKAETLRTARALKTFMRGLDREAYMIMRRAQLHGTNGATSDLSVRAYEWLCGNNERHDYTNRSKIRPARAVRGEALRNRRDVGRLWGGLLEYIMSEETTAAIDAGNPRVPALTRCFGRWAYPAYDLSADNSKRTFTPCPPEFVQWLRGRPWEEFHGQSKFQYDRLHGAFAVASALPPQLRPRTAEEWKTFDRSERTIAGIAGLLERDFASVALDVAHIFNRKTEYPDRALKRADTVQDAFTANFADHHNLGNLTDFLGGIPAPIILPALFQQAMAGRYRIPPQDNITEWTEANPISAQSNYSFVTAHLARGMFRGLTVSELIRFANIWHRRLNRIQTRTMKLDGDYRWIPLFKGPFRTRDGAVEMQCLTNSAELVYAGKRLDNCVGGYTFKCIYGTSHIIQMENQHTLEQALLEVRDVKVGEDSDCYKLEILQIEAPSNQPAAAWAVAAANELIKRANAPARSPKQALADLRQINIDRDSLRQEIGMNILILRAGFDPSNVQYADEAYHALHHEMREMFPQATRGEYLAARGISQEIPVWLKKQAQWRLRSS
ncbi:MAG: hypothetical protein EBQ96_09540 [Proteobacteria bacterium]|nr:hypothetical protein [Pseudomonadota bacterium]